MKYALRYMVPTETMNDLPSLIYTSKSQDIFTALYDLMVFVNPLGHVYTIFGGSYVMEPYFSNTYVPLEDCVREVAVPVVFVTFSGLVTFTVPTAVANEKSLALTGLSVLTDAYKALSDPYVPNLNLKSLIVSLQFVT